MSMSIDSNRSDDDDDDYCAGDGDGMNMIGNQSPQQSSQPPTFLPMMAKINFGLETFGNRISCLYFRLNSIQTSN